MAKLSPSDAAVTIGVSRQTIYRYIKQGKISRDPDGRIDTAELLRAGFNLQQVDVTLEEQKLQGATAHLEELVTELRQERNTLTSELEISHQEKAQLLNLLTSQQRLLEAGVPKRVNRWHTLKSFLSGRARV